MPKIKRQKIKHRIYLKYIFCAFVIAAANACLKLEVNAKSCPDVEFVFARGSGEERWTGQNYLVFKSEIENKITDLRLKFEFLDLDYPAIGIDNMSVIAGAFFGAGESYEFGRSVETGVNKLVQMINHDTCKKTKYVLGGYSQGAMVVSKALHDLNADKVIYAATFGDPKIFLPEGKSWFAVGFGSNSGKNFMRTGTIPAACKNENLSEYRMYVPDCYAYEGLLGSYQPYQPTTFSGKVGTWCNKRDLFCSSYFVIDDHIAYVSDGLYEDASRVIYDKVATYFGREKTYASPHDTVILIDSTGSMSGLIERYKAEAKNLAEKTWAAGGRVALYDYRDLNDPYEPVERCNFKTCNAKTFDAGLKAITVDGGGDTPESLLSAANNIMRRLDWTVGVTKSVVVLTDAGYHNPDRDNTRFEEVVKLSKEIDPVNFYVVTSDQTIDDLVELAAATSGRVVKSSEDLAELTDYIMARYDALPRVEENVALEDLPMAEITDVIDEGASVSLRIQNTGTKTLVILNDLLLGFVEDSEITINGLDRAVQNEIRIVAFNETRRGNSDYLTLGAQSHEFVPLAPNTGRI